MVEAQRDLSKGNWDAYMWYHIKMWVSDLDPYVEAFEAVRREGGREGEGMEDGPWGFGR